MSAARLIHILAILQQETNADKALTLHQIHDKLLLRHPEEQCSEQRVREDLSVLETLSEEGTLLVRVESSAGAHNQRRYKAYHSNFGLNEARMVFDSISISRFLSPRQKRELISQLEGYLSEQEVRRLASSYQQKITILCGIEQDIFSGPAESRWDYAIGSVHAFYNREFDRYIYVDYSKDQMIRDCEECYGGDFLAMAEDYFATEATVITKTGADIIGHFDLVTKFNEQEKMFEESHPRYEAAVDNALAKLLATGAVFEINTGAMSKGYRTSPYPSESILRKIKIGGGKIIISSDTHTADTIDFAFADAARLAKLCGFEKLDYPGRTVAL